MAPLAAGAIPTSAGANPAQPRRVKIGDVLNHLYEVRRFIARGGMGEVFEGVNINSEDERVAIKVILPHLASDPHVLAMFRKEARTLTRLSHPALVQYRTFPHEPQLGVYYIVTEYIDGGNMSDLLGTLKPAPAEVGALMRRLAEGLAVAHSLGAIHRDISPDNVMLEGDRLDRARIIDFGIVKDLDAGSQTLIGDGFAGKLNYVAPEQLGDFDRAVGPWSDVYSLGLTMLALLSGRDVNMGGTLVEAVDKRRAGPDLSAVPDELRPVLEAMLRPNPQDRLRSMEDVVATLAGREAKPAAVRLPIPVAGAAKPPPPLGPAPTRQPGGSKKPLMIGGGALGALLVLGSLGYALWGGSDTDAPEAAPVAATGSAIDPVATAQSVLQAGLGQVRCSWLDVADLQARGSDIALALRGVAGDPIKAQNEIGAMLSAKGLRAASLDSSDVQQIGAADCGPLEAFRQIRSSGGSHIKSAQSAFKMDILPPDSVDAGKIGAAAVLDLDLNGVAGDFVLVGIEDSGAMELVENLTREVLGDPANEMVTARPGVYRISLDTTHKGWSGIVLLAGKGPFDPALFNGTTASRGPDWANRFLSRAKAQGWQAEMVWYKTYTQTNAPPRAGAVGTVQ